MPSLPAPGFRSWTQPNIAASKVAMPGIGWEGHLNEASSQEDVVAVCNQFLTIWAPDELAELLAAGCYPKDVIKLEDVGQYAAKLTAKPGADDPMTAPMLYRMTSFFTKAALRLVEIAASQSRRDPAQQKHSSRSS
jgi:hypothetical protein